MKKFSFSLAFLTLFACLGMAKGTLAPDPPDRLSDLQRFMGMQYQRVFGENVRVKTLILGLSKDILATGRFRKVESELSAFTFQDLRFDKAGFLFDHFWVDPAALSRWDLVLEKVGEAQNHLTFTIPSLQAKISKESGRAVVIKPDVAEQVLELSGRASFLGIPCDAVARTVLAWDGQNLRLEPRQVKIGKVSLPRWTYWVMRGPWPREPVLRMGSLWIPWNIQELHLSWDKITLSTNW